MKITQTIPGDVEGEKPTEHVAAFDGATFTSDNASFALWLNATFPIERHDGLKFYANASELTKALEGAGLKVTGSVPWAKVESVDVSVPQ